MWFPPRANPLRLVVLTSSEAEDAWKVRIAGSDHLLITGQDFLADPDAHPARIGLRSLANPHFEFSITPPTSAPLQANVPLIPAPPQTAPPHSLLRESRMACRIAIDRDRA